MRTLEFIGNVQADASPGLTLPGSGDLILVSEDWPVKSAPGTLTVQVNDDGFPEGFEEIGDGDGLKKLNDGKFRPEFVIPARLIHGNEL